MPAEHPPSNQKPRLLSWRISRQQASPLPVPTRLSLPSHACPLAQDELKKQAAWKAVDYVKSNMVVGLGTGSTAAFAVDRLGQLLKEGKLTNIIGVPTSVRTYEQAKALGIPLATLDEQPHINVAIDGADEVDPNLDVVKGRGGALLREKMVEMVRAGSLGQRDPVVFAVCPPHAACRWSR